VDGDGGAGEQGECEESIHRCTGMPVYHCSDGERVD
jgi:hypothetical protein